MTKRCWEEARRLGTPLAAHPGRAGLETNLRTLGIFFEVPHTPEEEAMHFFLTGMVVALEADAPWPSNGDGDDD